MKKTSVLILILITGLFFVSCEQPTILSVSQTALSFDNNGGNQSVTLTANKLWTASSNQGWLRVSPSSGEGTTTLSVSCEGNTTYDSRTGNITIVSEELTQTISVTQAEGLGLIVSQTEYNITNDAQTLSVEVQANVQYIVDIDAACRDWIKQNSTKGLSTNIIKFDISKNETYDGREGKITIRQTNGSLSATVVVKQSQTNAMFVDQTVYDISYEEQQLAIKVKANVDYDVQIDDSCKDWISRVGTKGLTESTVTLAIKKNEDAEREGKVVLSYQGNQEAITIKQKGGYVVFEDANFKAYCLNNFDKNRDKEISIDEAAAVTFIDVNTDNIQSLKGIEFFTNLITLRCLGSERYIDGETVALGKLKSLDVSNCILLSDLYCAYNQISTLIVSGYQQHLSHWSSLHYLHCSYNQLTSLDVSDCSGLYELMCDHNQLTSLDINFYINSSSLNLLYCNNNNLSSLNLSKLKGLIYLRCSDNQITSLDVSTNTSLKEVECNNNQLATINVSNCASLEKINCSDNLLVNLDIANCTTLKNIYCSNNQINYFDVSHNTALEHINCNNNKLFSLDVSKNTSLTSLFCSGNHLGSLDIMHHNNLQYLYCDNNQLVSLTVQDVKHLNKLHCENNLLTSLALPNCDVGELLCNNNRLTSLDVFGYSSLYYLDCNNNQLNSLNISKNTRLNCLKCSYNNLSSLDISNNTSLGTLECISNKLQSLDVSNTLRLNWLLCYDNPNLSEIWLKTGQTIQTFQYDTDVATIKYK